MPATLMTRQPAPALACTGMRVRRCVRADAFGNALGSSVVGMATQGSQQEVRLQGAGPWSAGGYVNGMDLQSDTFSRNRQSQPYYDQLLGAFGGDAGQRYPGVQVAAGPGFGGLGGNPGRTPTATELQAEFRRTERQYTQAVETVFGSSPGNASGSAFEDLGAALNLGLHDPLVNSIYARQFVNHDYVMSDAGAASVSSLQPSDGMLSNLASTGHAYLNGGIGFRGALSMANGQIGGIDNVARDTLTGLFNGGIGLAEFGVNLLGPGPGHLEFPKFGYTGQTGSLGPDVALMGPMVLGTMGARNAAAMEAATAATSSVVRSAMRPNDGPQLPAGRMMPNDGPQLPNAYSVLTEVKLAPADFGRSRTVHFNRSNAELDSLFKVDSDFAALLESHVPGIQNSASAVGGRSAPAGWTWEHASSSTASGQQGVMRLVPTEQHTPGSPFWRVLHPDPGARGGYSEWAIPAGAPKNGKPR